MIEKQIHYKDKKGNNCVAVAYYNRKFGIYMFDFAEEEFKELFKRLGIKFEFKIVR